MQQKDARGPEPLDVSEQGLWDLAVSTIDVMGGRMAGETPEEHFSRTRFLYLRFVRISERQKQLLG